MVCLECKKAKVKCSGNPCERCVRLNRVCVHHLSAQGRKRKGSEVIDERFSRATRNNKIELLEIDKTSTNDDINDDYINIATASNNQNPSIQQQGHINMVKKILTTTNKSSNLPTHYGFNCLIRCWVSMSFRR